MKKTKPITAHALYAEMPDGSEAVIARVFPASDKDVKAVLTAEPMTTNGRSEYVWVRLSSGDLILGVFPRGDTYENGVMADLPEDE